MSAPTIPARNTAILEARALHALVLDWARDRYGPRLVERGELPAGVYDRQHARREARAAEGEARRHYERIANGGRHG